MNDSVFNTKYNLRKFMEQEFSDDPEKFKKLAKLIAAYSAALIREDRVNRKKSNESRSIDLVESLFKKIFGD